MYIQLSILAVAFVAVCAEPPTQFDTAEVAPYSQSGWRPSGPEFRLPQPFKAYGPPQQEQNQLPKVEARYVPPSPNNAPPQQSYGPASQEYKAPSQEYIPPQPAQAYRVPDNSILSQRAEAAPAQSGWRPSGPQFRLPEPMTTYGPPQQDQNQLPKVEARYVPPSPNNAPPQQNLGPASQEYRAPSQEYIPAQPAQAYRVPDNSILSQRAEAAPAQSGRRPFGPQFRLPEPITTYGPPQQEQNPLSNVEGRYLPSSPNNASPQQSYGPASQEYRAPSQEYGPPQPAQEYRAPENSIQSQRAEAAPAESGWRPSGPQFRLPEPITTHGPPQQEQNQSSRAEPQEFLAPPPSYTSPQQNYGPPPQEYRAPVQEYGPPQPPQAYGPPEEPSTTTIEPEATTTELPTTTDSNDLEAEELGSGNVDEQNEKLTGADEGIYYIYHPNGLLQKVIYATKDDVENMAFSARLKYENVEPINGPIFTYDPQTYAFRKL